MQRLGLASLLGAKSSRERELVLAMVAARIVAPQTKLATTRWWHTTTLAEDFGVADADEDDLYGAMDWLLAPPGADSEEARRAALGGRRPGAVRPVLQLLRRCYLSAGAPGPQPRRPQGDAAGHVSPMPVIERGTLDGSLHVGIIPAHRSSRSLVYQDLFDETMLLYCGADHPLFGADDKSLTWPKLRQHAFASLGYHSPNMELSHRAQFARKATGFDQEAIATMVLSGRYLGFLPDHYAAGFEREGRLRAVQPRRFRYECRFVSVLRRSPEPARAALVFSDCLRAAHAG